METMDKEAAKQSEALAADLLNGGAEIAEFLGCNTREVYHLVKTGRLPIGRLGRKLIASRSQLRRAAKTITAA
jgi:excisionase family DNA binding protein